MKTFPSLFPAAVAAVHVCALYQTDGLLHGRGLNVTQTRLAVTEQADYGYGIVSLTPSLWDPLICEQRRQTQPPAASQKGLTIRKSHAINPWNAAAE